MRPVRAAGTGILRTRLPRGLTGPRNPTHAAGLGSAGPVCTSALDIRVPTTLYRMREAPHTEGTELWDEAATVLRWVQISYLTVNIPKGADVRMRSTPLPGSCTPVHIHPHATSLILACL